MYPPHAPRRPTSRRAAPIVITPDFNRYAEGSALIEFGETRVICTASVEEKVPPFLEGQGQGLGHRRVRDAAALDHTRASRARARGGRGQEIQRLIGRALRAAVDMRALGAAADHRRLRRHPGRRRHAHGGDHRRLGGAGAGHAAAGGSARSSPRIRSRLGRGGGVGRHRRRRGARSTCPTPRTPQRRSRLQRRHDRRRQVRRDPGHRRDRAVLGRAVRDAGGAGAQPAASSCSRRSGQRWPRAKAPMKVRRRHAATAASCARSASWSQALGFDLVHRSTRSRPSAS